ncbi:MAG: LytR C-terminal domain-containing protein [Acidimicrobiales bacterium]
MSPGKHATDDSSFGRSMSGAMLRSVALIVVAVVLGIVLLQATDGPDPFTATTGQDDRRDQETTTTVPVGVDPSTTTTSAPAAVVDPSTVTVLVANGSGGVAGLAGDLTGEVEEAGFQVTPPANVEAVETSVVFFTTGFEEAATAVAGLFDPALEVAPLPDPSPVDDLRGANVVVVAGPDLAPE